MARPTEFDPQEKLQQAMRLFWRKGYKGASMQALVAEMGINRFSIYNTFGDKEALFLKALEHYGDTVTQALIDQLQPAKNGLPQLFRYLEVLQQKVDGPTAGIGCLLQNTVLEAVGSDSIALSVESIFRRKRQALFELIRAARQQGQLATSLDDEACADFVLAQVQGAIILRKALGTEAFKRSLAVLRGTIEQWAAAS